VAIKYLTFAGIQHSSVFTTAPFKKGDRFGPFQGKNVYASEIKTDDGNAYMWEVIMYPICDVCNIYVMYI